MSPIAVPLRRALILAIVLLPLACGKLPFGKDSQYLVKERVGYVLGASFAGDAATPSDYQKAACRWYADRDFLNDRDELEAAVDGFDVFLRAKGLTMGSIRQLTVEEVQDGTADDPAGTLLVHVRINDELHWLAVPPKAPMSWR